MSLIPAWVLQVVELTVPVRAQQLAKANTDPKERCNWHVPPVQGRHYKFSVVPEARYIHLFGTLQFLLFGTLQFLQLGTLHFLVITQVPNIDIGIVLGLSQGSNLQICLDIAQLRTLHWFPAIPQVLHLLSYQRSEGILNQQHKLKTNPNPSHFVSHRIHLHIHL